MVPLIMRGPLVAEGKRSSTFVDWIDIHATFLALSGIGLPDHAQEMDMSAVLSYPQARMKDETLSELLGRKMIWTEKHKLVICDDGSGELYDLS